MAQGKNTWHGIGHLGADSKLTYTKRPAPVVSFRIACGDRYRNAEGEWQEHTEWVNCVLFGARAEGIWRYLLKGTRVSVEGSLRTRSYLSKKDNIERYVTEVRLDDIILLSSPEGRQIRNEVSEEVPQPENRPEDFSD